MSQMEETGFNAKAQRSPFAELRVGKVTQRRCEVKHFASLSVSLRDFALRSSSLLVGHSEFVIYSSLVLTH